MVRKPYQFSMWSQNKETCMLYPYCDHNYMPPLICYHILWSHLFCYNILYVECIFCDHIYNWTPAQLLHSSNRIYAWTILTLYFMLKHFVTDQNKAETFARTKHENAVDPENRAVERRNMFLRCQGHKIAFNALYTFVLLLFRSRSVMRIYTV